MSPRKKPVPAADNESSQVPALDRALNILELLAQHPDGMRMREIAEKLELPANSVFRLTATLDERGVSGFQLGRQFVDDLGMAVSQHAGGRQMPADVTSEVTHTRARLRAAPPT